MIANIEWAADMLGVQNEDEKLSNGYGGTQDGIVAEKLYSAQLQMRAMSFAQLKKVEEAFKDEEHKK